MAADDDAVRHPAEAGPPRTSGPTRTYENDDLRVVWDATRCIHVAKCLHALPEVFDVTARPWIDLSGASAEAIAETVRLCPTGALRYESRSNLADEMPEDPTVIEIRPNGPLYLRGRFKITNRAGDVVAEETRVALCRCGASENKPFCDNSHRLIGFRG